MGLIRQQYNGKVTEIKDSTFIATLSSSTGEESEGHEFNLTVEQCASLEVGAEFVWKRYSIGGGGDFVLFEWLGERGSLVSVKKEVKEEKEAKEAKAS